MRRLTLNNNDGYEYISNRNIKYSLYEGTSIGGSCTSDIVFVMNDLYPEIDDKVYENGKVYPFGYELVGWFYGATFIDEPNYRDDFMTGINRLVDKYEEENQDIVELILKVKDQKGE